MLFQSCETTIFLCLHRPMFKQHTCSKWAQQHVFNVLQVTVGPLIYPKFAPSGHRGKSTVFRLVRTPLLAHMTSESSQPLVR